MIVKLLLINVLTWKTAESLNFLLIVVDDLRTSLGCYGDENAHTPNIDKLAERGVLFSQAYAQQSLCAPSRNSFLTSRRPDTLQLYDFYNYWRDTVGNFTTLPQHLKDHGYRTKSIGKVFHPGKSSNYSDDSPYSWTEKPFHPATNRYKNSPVCPCPDGSSTAANLVCPVSVDSMPGKSLPDLEILEAAKTFIKKQTIDDGRFFLAVGFEKPHIPLKFPREYLKYHPLIKFDVVDPYKWPGNISDVAYNPWTDIRQRDDVKNLRLKFPWEKIPVDFAKKIVQSYYASVTYIDELIGKLLDELHLSSFQNNTVVILTSDHGWSLGEHAEWAKYSNFEVALQVPFIIWIPRANKTRETITNPTSEAEPREDGDRAEGQSRDGGCTVKLNGNPEKSDCRQDVTRAAYRISRNINNVTRVYAMIELVDIFPTIAELAGFPISICPENEVSDNCIEDVSSVPNSCSEGISLLPLIESAMENKMISWKTAAFSQYPRPGMKPTLKPNSDKPRLDEITVMGHSVRTSSFRYTIWIPFSPKERKPDWHNILAEELYDHDLDPGENSNIAANPKFFDVKVELRYLLRCGWRKALPEAMG